VQTRSGRGAMLLIHGLWLRPGIWEAWLDELDAAGYDAVVLSWSEGDRSPDRGPAAAGGFDALIRTARRRARTQRTRPIVVGHGVGGAVAARRQPPRAAQPEPRPGRAVLRPVPPDHGQCRRQLSSRRFYAEYLAACPPRAILLPVLRRPVPAGGRAPRRGPLLLAAGGKDQLIRETSVAARHRRYQADAITDYQVFPYLDHTLTLGTPGRAVLFYCLDWLTAHEL
jgi:Alpha/beta hydrolase family